MLEVYSFKLRLDTFLKKSCYFSPKASGQMCSVENLLGKTCSVKYLSRPHAGNYCKIKEIYRTDFLRKHLTECFRQSQKFKR